MPGNMSEKMTDRMTENMPDGMPEYMSDRMLQVKMVKSQNIRPNTCLEMPWQGSLEVKYGLFVSCCLFYHFCVVVFSFYPVFF